MSPVLRLSLDGQRPQAEPRPNRDLGSTESWGRTEFRLGFGRGSSGTGLTSTGYGNRWQLSVFLARSCMNVYREALIGLLGSGLRLGLDRGSGG